MGAEVKTGVETVTHFVEAWCQQGVGWKWIGVTVSKGMRWGWGGDCGLTPGRQSGKCEFRLVMMEERTLSNKTGCNVL